MTATTKMKDIDDIIHNMTAAELWAMNEGVAPIQINWTKEEAEKAQKIYDLMDLTELEYEDIECILDTPHKARLCDIQTYCNALNINVLDFIEKALTLPFAISEFIQKEEEVLV